MKLVLIGTVFSCFPAVALADSLDEEADFFVNPDYDFWGREKIEATLREKGVRTYFYIDNKWWNSLENEERYKVQKELQELDSEFYRRIYPTLTLKLGSEWSPGIDNDSRITILCHPLKKEVGGYFSNGDEYSILQNPRSNQREMFYFNADFITHPLSESFLAHEMVHLITFNQKEKKYGVQEEVWLDEARAEYAPTLVGYDADYEGSNLEQRVKIFLENPSDSLTEWQGKPADYGALSLFTQYLVEQYGIDVLVDSLRSRETGIASLNKALEENGFEEDFSDVFTDWTIAVFANNCFLGKEYCYENENLKKVRITPSLNFLPLKGKSSLGVTQSIKNWSGNWLKFIGSKGDLKIEMIGNPENRFVIPYLAQNLLGEYSLDFFELDEYQRGNILVPGFGTGVNSVTIIPSVQSKVSGFKNPEPEFTFFWEASTLEAEEVENSNSVSLPKPITQMSKSELLDKIEEIEELLNQLKDQLARLESEEEKQEDTEPLPLSCQNFDKNLFYGIQSDNQVRCLQEFLKSQGSDIYPEGLVTGNFLYLTKTAVTRFQEKYAQEILEPLGLMNGTGFVGPKTRAKINEMLAG